MKRIAKGMQALRGRLVEWMVVMALVTVALAAVGLHAKEARRLLVGGDSLEQLLQSFNGREVDVTDGGEVVRGRLQAGADALCVTLAPGGNEPARCYAYAEVRSVLVEGSPSRAVVTVNDRPTLNQGR